MEKVKPKNSVPIVAINRITEKTFVLDGNKIEEYADYKKGKRKEFFITYIPYKDIVTANVEISKTTPDNETADAITIKTYEELLLDTNDDYKITYLEIPISSNDSTYYNVFAINNTLLSGDLEAIANHTEYIDYVAIAPFLMTSLYKRNIITPEGVDCFLYLQQDDAFIAIYQNGEYFDSRPIRYNLNFILDKFSELLGNRCSKEKFFTNLTNRGLNAAEDPIERDYLIEIFDEMIFYVGDIINSICKINNINIKNMYFSTDIGDIPGIEIFIEDRLALTPKKFDFSIALNQKEYKDITQLDILMILSAQEYILSKDNSYNYSPFLRPPPLKERDSGKLIGICLLAFFATMAYPTYQYIHGFFNQTVANQKNNEFQIKNAERTRISNALAAIQAEIDQTKEKFSEQNTILSSRIDTLDAMYDKKVNYPMKSKAIYDISHMINRNIGLLSHIKSDDKNMTFSVRTESEKKMTELLKNISNTPKYSVDTKSIILDENNATIAYESNVSVEVK
ncbi:MAG: hypothetical protein GXZ15_01770 [Campylobacter sp.]|nr:hypothetical protein [Campylobacter sp.]